MDSLRDGQVAVVGSDDRVQVFDRQAGLARDHTVRSTRTTHMSSGSAASAASVVMPCPATIPGESDTIAWIGVENPWFASDCRELALRITTEAADAAEPD